jgi:hypothetical protein
MSVHVCWSYHEDLTFTTVEPFCGIDETLYRVMSVKGEKNSMEKEMVDGLTNPS